MTPIVLSSTFAQESPGVHKGYEYSRSGNPTRRALETCLAALENGQYGFAFASGLGATATLLHTLSPGAHILCGDDVYGGTFRLMDKVMAPLGIASSFVDMRNPEAVRAAIRPETKMLWIETPTNPMLKVFDIVLAMTNGQWQSQVLANLMFDWMFRGNDTGRASAVALVIMIMVTLPSRMSHRG